MQFIYAHVSFARDVVEGTEDEKKRVENIKRRNVIPIMDMCSTLLDTLE